MMMMEMGNLHSTITNMAPADLTLYYPNGDQEQFWQDVRQSDVYLTDIREIQAEGERLLSCSIPNLTYSLFAMFTSSGSRLEYEGVYFERRRRLNTFAILSLLEPERKEYRNAFYDMLWSVCDEYSWCLPAHLGEGDAAGKIDLFSAETGFTLSEMLVLTGDKLPPLLRSRVETEITKRLFRPYLDSEHHWETARHNWSAVCAGSIGSAALLRVQDPGMLTKILEKVQRSMECYLAGFGEDGACLEGLGYWNYGFGYFVYYADLLRQRSRGALDWLQREKVRSIALFQQKAFLGGIAVVNFSDSLPEGSVQAGLSHYLAGHYGEFQLPPLSLRAAYTEDHCSRWAPAFRNLIWRKQGLVPTEWAGGSCYLPDAQWLISRFICEEGAFGFAAKGGNNTEPHNHNDIGQFIVYGAGEVFLSDLGSGEYTAGYFGQERYSYDCNGSQGHSVPIIDGHYQPEGGQHAAIVLEAITAEAEDRLKLDCTSAYRYPGLERLTRSWIWDKRGQRPVITLEDEFRFGEVPGCLTERFVTRLKPHIVTEGRIMLPGVGDRRLGLNVFYDGQLVQPEITRRLYHDHFGHEAIWYTIDLIVKKPEAAVRIELRFEFSENNEGKAV